MAEAVAAVAGDLDVENSIGIGSFEALKRETEFAEYVGDLFGGFGYLDVIT